MRRLWHGVILTLGGLALPALLVVSVDTAAAATFNVEDANAVGDSNPGDGECKSRFSALTVRQRCTLNAAVEEANALPGSHPILVPAGTFRFDAVQLSDGLDLVIRRPITIIGQGASQTELTASGIFNNRITVAPAATLELRNLTYRDSSNILNDGGTLRVNNSIVRDNR